MAIDTDLGFDPDALRERYRQEREKRLRPDGNAQYIEVKGDFSRYVDDPHVEPGFKRPPLTNEVEVVIIGGGFGGEIAAAKPATRGTTARTKRPGWRSWSSARRRIEGSRSRLRSDGSVAAGA